MGDIPLLTFVGPPGTGKSWASWATTGLFLLRHETFRYVDWYELDQWAKDSRLFGDEGAAARGILNGLKSTELLVVDEFATAKPYEAEFMTVMAVIHHRFNRCLKTILITTRSEAELTASVGEALVSRINSNSGIVVKMTGRDKRQKPN